MNFISVIDSVKPKGYNQYWFKFNAENIAKSINDAELYKIRKFFYSCNTAGLAILHWSFYKESEYTMGVSTKVEVFNPTGKTINIYGLHFLVIIPLEIGLWT